MKTIIRNNKRYISKARQAGLLLSLCLFTFGAASCSRDTREEDQEVAEEVNTGLETSEWEAREGQSEWGDKNIENVTNTPRSQFNELDADRDQRMTYEEFGAATGEVEYLNNWDTDNDQQFSERELNEGLFNNWDRNKDSALDGAEYQAYNSAWGERQGDNFSTWDANQDKRLDLEEFDTGQKEAGTFDAWDANGDGYISREELRRGTYDARDLDRDGYLTNEEYEDMDYNIWGLNNL